MRVTEVREIEWAEVFSARFGVLRGMAWHVRGVTAISVYDFLNSGT